MALLPSLLGSDFETLDPLLQWVHGGESRRLRGVMTVQRGAGVLARVLGALASLPPSMIEAPITVHIRAAGPHETWTRGFAQRHTMVSALRREGDLLVERLGPCDVKFQLSAHGGELRWMLARIAVCGVALPSRWFGIRATVDAKHGRYHVSVEAGLRRFGSIVRYEGWLRAAG